MARASTSTAMDQPLKVWLLTDDSRKYYECLSPERTNTVYNTVHISNKLSNCIYLIIDSAILFSPLNFTSSNFISTSVSHQDHGMKIKYLERVLAHIPTETNLWDSGSMVKYMGLVRHTICNVRIFISQFPSSEYMKLFPLFRNSFSLFRRQISRGLERWKETRQWYIFLHVRLTHCFTVV